MIQSAGNKNLLKFQLIIGIFTAMLVSIRPAGADAQSDYFSDLPLWSSIPANWTNGMALGDVDGDGDLDLVCGNSRNEPVTLYENTPTGLSPVPIWSSGPLTVTGCVAFGDVDGDGDLDLVSGNYMGQIMLYENTGYGLTTEPVWLAESSDSTRDIVLGDIDGDGDLDLVCGNEMQPDKLYENIGGTFTTEPVWESSTRYFTSSIALGDVDDDGDLDLVCGHYRTLEFNAVYENTGAWFATEPTFIDTERVWTADIELGDVDGDGDLDLVCGTGMGDYNMVFEDTGSAFAPYPIWISSINESTNRLALGDVDGDGDLDLVCGNWNQPCSMYENIGGTFTAEPVWQAEFEHLTRYAMLGDMDGDGDLDFIVGNREQPNVIYENLRGAFTTAPKWVSSESDRTLTLGLGDIDRDGDLDLISSGFFMGLKSYYNYDLEAVFTHNPVQNFGAVDDFTEAIALGDISGDGYPDVVVGNYYSPAQNKLYRNRGGTFANEPIWISGPANSTSDVALGDMDGDGDLDLVCGNNGSNTHYGNTNGSLSPIPIWTSEAANPTWGIALGDVDRDGDLDLVCGNTGPNTLYENIGGILSTEPAWISESSSNTTRIALGDVDGDGYLDLVCANGWTPGEANTLYKNTGGRFTPTPVWTSGLTKSTRGIALGDVDGDGDLDMACGNSSAGPNTLYENTGSVFTQMPVWISGPAWSTAWIELEDVDRDGDLDLVCGNDGNVNTLYKGLRNPMFQGDPTAPTDQLCNNGAVIRLASAFQSDENRYRVRFDVEDVESDRVWIVGEYQFAGEHTWRPIELVEGGARFGPVETTGEGVTDSLEWDITRVPFDDRDVVLRLRIVELPAYISIIQHAASYHMTIGPMGPVRPALESSTDSLLFSQVAVTVGDTLSLYFLITNTGNADLLVDQIDIHSDVEMRIDHSLPFIVNPGQMEPVEVYLEPRSVPDDEGDLEIVSNDPITPVKQITIVTDIRALKVTSKLLSPTAELPLGEAATALITPAPLVHVEQGHLLHRSTGEASFLDSVRLLPFEDDFVALIPGEAITEGGLEYYIKVENSGVFATDPPGAPDTFYTQAVESPAGISTNPMPNSGQDYLAGREIRVLVIMPEGSSFVSGALHYRMGGMKQYETVGLEPGEVFPEATIPSSAAGARGVEYWVDVSTLTTQLSDPPVDPSMRPRTLPITVQNLTEPRVHAGGTSGDYYRIMSIPLLFGEIFTGTIEALLSDQPEFGSYDPMKWRAWVYLHETGGYGELNDQSVAHLFRPEPGRAYWLICAKDHRISTAPISGVSTPTGGPFGIEIEPGKWNMVGSPFAFPVSWDSVRVDTMSMSEATGLLVDPPIRWDAGYRTDVAAMAPFEGYWIYNRADHRVTLWIPPEDTTATTPSPMIVKTAPTDGWRMSFRVTSAGVCDDFNTVGMSQSAATGLDRYDRMKPPPAPEKGLAMYFPHTGQEQHRYAVDIRPGTAAGDEWGEVWAFDIMKNFSSEKAGDAVTVAIDSVVNLPADAHTALIDRKLDRQLDLGETGAYEFFLGIRGLVEDEEEARFRLIVGSQGFVTQTVSNLLEIPSSTALYQNYPNPFNPSTIIRYEVAEPGPVSIRIYDVTGALVRILEDRVLKPGRYEIGWSGENDRGDRVAAGIYFYRLRAPGYSETRKMVLLK